jgi:hypothetical protein
MKTVKHYEGPPMPEMPEFHDGPLHLDPQWIEYHKERRNYDIAIAGTDACRRCRDPTDPTSHMGSASCRSRSLASGGSRSHCTCDTCF